MTTDGSLDEEITASRSLVCSNWPHLGGKAFRSRNLMMILRSTGAENSWGQSFRALLQPSRGQPVDAICFNRSGLLEARHIHCVYRIEVNRYRGQAATTCCLLIA